MQKLIEQNPKRLFAFGDSFTSYFWLTWPQIIAYDLDIPMYNYGKPAVGNEYIFNTVIQAINYHDINQDDLVIICWSSINRLDFRIKDRWDTITLDKWDVCPDFLKNVLSYPEGQAIRQFALIDSIHKILSNLCQFHMFSINDLTYLDFYSNPSPSKINLNDLQDLYNKTISDIKPSFAEALWDSDFDIKKIKDNKKINSSYVDLHPSPMEHLDYLIKIFPEYFFKPSTIDKINELEFNWINYLKENFPLFQNKKFNGYTDMLSGLTSQNTLVYNKSIRLI